MKWQSQVIFKMKKINLGISGCMGRMGQQLIKSSKNNKNFKLTVLTENKLLKKKINGIKPELNSENAFKKVDIIIDFTVPKCTLEVLDIAAKQKKKSDNWDYRFFFKRGKYNKKNFKKNSNSQSWKYESWN